MKSFRNKLVLLAALVATTAIAHQDDTDVSRLTLVHPDLGHEGGAALHTKIRNLYTRVGDNVATRYQEYTGVADSAVTTLTHGLGAPFADIVVVLYSGVAPSKTRIVDPVAAGWTIAAGGIPTTQVDITAPGSGGPHSFTVEIYEGLGSIAVQDADAVAITGGTIGNFVLDNYVDVNEESAPSTPSAGKIRVYGKADKKVYKKDSTGLETELGGGGGSGEINVIGNPNESTNWASTGAGVTVATTTTSSDLPLEGVVATAIKITPVSGTDYAYYCWTMPASLKNRKLKLSQEQRPLSGYASGDLKLDVYSYATASCGGAAARMALSTDAAAVTGVPNSTGKFTTTFDADASDYYGIRYTRVAGTTALNIVSVIVGPGIQPQGAAFSEVNPTRNFLQSTGLTITDSLTFRRVGDKLAIFGTLATTGTGSDASAFGIELPGLSLDGSMTIIARKQGAPDVGVPFRAFGQGDTIFFRVADNVTTDGSSINGTSFGNVTSGDYELLLFGGAMLSVAEWEGSGTVNLAQNDIEYAWNSNTADAADTTSFGYGPQGVNIGSFTAQRNKRVSFRTPVQPGEVVTLQTNSSAEPDVWQAWNGSIFQYVLQNTADYGISFAPVGGSKTEWTVTFHDYARASGATFGSAGEAWSTYTGVKWRLVKSKAEGAVGFGIADTQSAGLVSYLTQTLGGGKTIQGNASEIQLTVKANSTQSVDTMQVQNSTGDAMIEFENTGIIRNSSLIVGGSAGASQGELRLTLAGATISGGVLAVTNTVTRVIGQGGVSDTLDTINTCTDGDLVILRAFDDAATITISDGTGNIQTAGSVNFALNSDLDTWTAICFNGDWTEIARSDNGT